MESYCSVRGIREGNGKEKYSTHGELWEITWNWQSYLDIAGWKGARVETGKLKNNLVDQRFINSAVGAWCEIKGAEAAIKYT